MNVGFLHTTCVTMVFARVLVVSAIIGLAAADANIILPPVNGATDKNPTLLVFVPGGDVPNQVYAPLLKQLQTQLADKVQLWVAIPHCIGNLCIPKISSLEVKSALTAGRKASGITDPKKTWMAGHSLGGAEADTYMQANKGEDIGGGGMLWGAQILPNAAAMLKYPVPVLTLVGDLDYGSARLTKLSPYWAAGVRETANDPARSPVVVLQNVDHSDMCETFKVPGDLPSASPPDVATAKIAAASAAFMSRIITGNDEDIKTMVEHDKFTEQFMKPLNEALAQEQKGDWCTKAQLYIAGTYASKVKISTTVHPDGHFSSWPAPTAALEGGFVHIEVSEVNTGGAKPADDTLGATAKGFVPAPGRVTAISVGCRMIPRAKIAELLGEKDGANAENPCRAMNEKAWADGQRAPAYILARYNSSTPCNGCEPGLKVVFGDDKELGSEFTKTPFHYYVGGDTQAPAVSGKFTIASPTTLTDSEHSCQLMSPARFYDFLVFDAYAASRYVSSQTSAAMVV